MGSIIDGTLAVMGIIAGLVMVFMSLKASESPQQVRVFQSSNALHKSHRKAA